MQYHDTSLAPFHPSTEIVEATLSELPPIEDVVSGQIGLSTIAMYKHSLAAYSAWCTQERKDATDAQSLKDWRDSLYLHTDKSPHTINRMIASVKYIIREMADKKLLDDAVSIQFDRVHGVKVKALKERLKQHGRTRIEQEDMRRLCESPDSSTLVGKRDRALLATLASSGIRASELASLQVGQIVKRGRHHFLQVRGKTDIDYRDAHLSQEAYTLIMAWLDARPVLSSYVFTRFEGRGQRASDQPISEAGVWQTVKKYAALCELAHVKPHDFRRFLGTQLAAKDIRKAQLALGHKSIEITARHYVLDKLEGGLTDNLY